MADPGNLYRKRLLQPMRPYVPGEDLSKVSVNAEDTPEEGGMIAWNPDNPADQWYIAKKFFEDNYELAEKTCGAGAPYTGPGRATVGRVVHYVAYGTPGGEYAVGVHRAAIVTEVTGTDPMFIGLCVLNPSGMFFNDRVEFDPSGVRGGTWHWPERV